MARYPFGATIADFGTVVSGGLLYAAGASNLRFWSAQVGGTEFTDLLDASSAAILPGAYQTNADGTFPLLYGPDAVTVMWVDNASAPFSPERRKVTAHLDVVLAGFTGGGGGASTAATATKTTNYTAAAGEFVPVDLSTGNVTVTLPGAPPDKTQVGFFIQKTSATPIGAFSLTITRAGTDTFDSTTGATTKTMNMLEHSKVLQYQASSKVWFPVSSHTSITQYNTFNGTTYAPLGASYKQLVVATGDDLFLGYEADSAGLDVPAAATVNQLQIIQDRPAIAGANTYGVFRRVPGTNVETQIGSSITVAAGQVEGHTATGQAISLATDDEMTVALTSTTVPAGSYMGSGLKLRAALGTSTFPAVSTPGIPSALAVTASTATSVTLGWTGGTNASTHVITENGVPIAEVRGTTYTRTGITGTPSYDVAAKRYKGMSAFTGSPVTAAAQTVYASLPAANGNLDSTFWAVYLGSSPGTSMQVSSNVETDTSGTAGSANAQDVVAKKFIKAATPTDTAWIFDGLMSPGTTSAIHTIYMSATNMTSITSTLTDYLQFQFNQSGCRIGYKSATWNPATNGGSGSTGSFQNLTDSAYPTNLLTTGTRVAGGQISWGFTLNVGTNYGLRIKADTIAGTGTQNVTVQIGTAAAYTSNPVTMTTVIALTLPQSMRAALPAGYLISQQLGKQAAGSTSDSWVWNGSENVTML